MIGGVDVILQTDLPADRALDAAVRTISRRWPHAAFQDGNTGLLLRAYPLIRFAKLNEVLVYQDHSAFERWEEIGADPSTANTMIHLLSYKPGRLTVVVDDERATEMSQLISSIRAAITDRSWRMPHFVPPRREAA